MLRENWRSLAFWRWWWRESVRREVKFVLVLALLPLLLAGGYVAASGMTSARAANGSSSYVLETTVEKVITVREHGRVVVKRVPVVVRRSIVKNVIKNRTSLETVVDTKTVKTPGGTRYVTRKVMRYVPVVHKRVVRVKGKTTTVTETRLVPTVKTETNVVTNQQTVTNENTVVVNHTDTVVQPVTTVVTKTETETLPPDTVTVTKTETETQTDTQTVTETVTTTETVTEPAITITVPG